MNTPLKPKLYKRIVNFCYKIANNNILLVIYIIPLPILMGIDITFSMLFTKIWAISLGMILTARILINNPNKSIE